MKKDKEARKKEFQKAVKEKIKSLIVPVIILAIIVAGILVIAFYQETTEVESEVAVRGYTGQETPYIMENNDLKFEMDPETTQFTVTKKSTGKVWYSNPKGAEDDTVALKLDKEKLQSTLLLTYSTENGVDTLFNNYAYSMKDKLYEIEQGDDYIKVLYSIGDTEKEYVIPPVILQEDLEALMAKMDKKTATKVTDYYKKYDINNLGKRDNKEELLANYPILETNVIYVLRDTTKDNMKVKLEEYFIAAGYTQADCEKDKLLDMRNKVSDKPVFNVSIVYKIEGDELVVSVPLNEVEYRESKPVYQLTVLPFFGAGGKEDTGFMVVPEGGGAIINFNNGKVSQNSYVANLYGWDNCEDRDSLVHETRANFNAFGISNGDDSFVCYLEDGSSYASVQADISGKNNSYNSANVIYSMLHRNKYDVGDRTTAEMYVYESSLPDEEFVQRYEFLDTNSYVDMAKAYGSYLEEKYDGYLEKLNTESTPVVVEVVGAIDKIKQICGVPVLKPLKLTSYKEAQNIVSDLKNRGFEELSVKYSGWYNDGVEPKIAKKVKTVSELGSKKDLTNMIKAANDLGVDVYLDGVTNYEYKSGVFDGFNKYTDAAKFISKQRVEMYPYSTITYEKMKERDSYYLLKGTEIPQMADNIVAAADKFGAQVSFREYGNELASDFNQKELVSRENAKNNQASQLKQYKDAGKNIMINMGNDYAIAYADIITNMDLAGYEYSIIDSQIPFYQLAIHGLVDYTGDSINLSKNVSEELLKSAEYGAGLSFTFTQESAFALQTTFYTQYYGADYSSWADEASEIYTRYNQELGHTFNQKMTNHEFVGNGITCTTYEDGTKVYVNYSYEAKEASDGTKVPARDYLVKK